MALYPLQEPGGTARQPAAGELLDFRLELDQQSIECLSDMIEHLTARVAALEALLPGSTALPG